MDFRYYLLWVSKLSIREVEITMEVQSNSIIVEKMVAPKFSTILEFSTIMDFCVVQGNELSTADRVCYVNCEFLFTA